MVYKVRWTTKQRAAFVKRWLRFREKYGVTQQGIAEALEISIATVNRVERGKFVPRDETVVAFGELEKKYADGARREREMAWTPRDHEEI